MATELEDEIVSRRFGDDGINPLVRCDVSIPSYKAHQRQLASQREKLLTTCPWQWMYAGGDIVTSLRRKLGVLGM